jgi:hypothetical protein
MGLGAIERGGRGRLVARQLGIMDGSDGISARPIMIGEGFVGLLFAMFRAARPQRLRDMEVQGLALAQSDGIVDHVAGEAVLEPQGSLALAWEDEILVGQPGDERILLAAAGEQLQQPGGDDVADHGGGTHQPGLRFGEPREARFDEDVEPRAALVRPRVGLARGDRMAQLLDEQRVAAG